MIQVTEKQFLALSKKGNLVPVYKELIADLETPVSAYFRVASEAKYSFLLESVEGEEKVARFSFLAKDPELIVRTKDSLAEILYLKNGKVTKKDSSSTGSPLLILRNLMKKYKYVEVDGLPRFCGGMVGYMSYDIVRFFEKLPQKTKDDLKLPDTFLMLARELIVFDHRNHKLKVVSCVDVPHGTTTKEKKSLYQKAVRTINRRAEELNSPIRITQAKKRSSSKSPQKTKITSNFTKKQFTEIVKEAKKQIKKGEIIQVVLSQRFETPIKTDPFNIYRMLRVLNPSPYMYFLNFDSVQIIGSSPELLVRCENGIVETRPIAGTRPRGKDEKQDDALARELLADEKEKAEHIMLVDLGRNDLGRVCEKGSVHLSEFMNVERYSHVMHIVSNVKGRLKRGKDSFDVLEAGFPAGTVSGAPKIRAMEIIEDLEKVKRGPYAGCIGYLSFSGNLDTCITIRTIITANGKAYTQAGAGIVADSKPEKEYQETINKAKAQIQAITKAEIQN